MNHNNARAVSELLLRNENFFFHQHKSLRNKNRCGFSRDHFILSCSKYVVAAGASAYTIHFINSLQIKVSVEISNLFSNIQEHSLYFTLGEKMSFASMFNLLIRVGRQMSCHIQKPTVWNDVTPHDVSLLNFPACLCLNRTAKWFIVKCCKIFIILIQSFSTLIDFTFTFSFYLNAINHYYS